MGRGVADGANAVGSDAEADSVRLLSVSWNQDSSCFTALTTADFRIFNCGPFHEKLRHVFHSGYAVVNVEVLLRTNIFAFVAAEEGGERHRVLLWDDSEGQSVHVDFPSAVRAVRLSREYLVVVLDRKVIVYNLSVAPRPRPIWTIGTALNPRGLCCLSCLVCTSVLACPGMARGQVRVQNLLRMLGEKVPTPATLIAAHSSDLACMAMTVDGAVLATASVKGTLIRVFNAMDGTCLQEVRRGRDQADIYSIALSPNLKWLAVSSDKGTLHVFRLRVGDAGGKQSKTATATAPPVVETNTPSNARSSLSFMKVILPDYFSSEWSFTQFRLPETTRYVATFGENNTVMIIGMDGSFQRCSFDPANGKEMVRKEYFRFIKDKDSPSSS